MIFLSLNLYHNRKTRWFNTSTVLNKKIVLQLLLTLSTYQQKLLLTLTQFPPPPPPIEREQTNLIIFPLYLSNSLTVGWVMGPTQIIRYASVQIFSE